MIFISYSWKNHEPAAEIENTLGDAGIEVYFDRRAGMAKETGLARSPTTLLTARRSACFGALRQRPPAGFGMNGSPRGLSAKESS